MPFRRPTAPSPTWKPPSQNRRRHYYVGNEHYEQPAAVSSNSLPDLSEFRLQSVSFGRKTTRNRHQHIPLGDHEDRQIEVVAFRSRETPIRQRKPLLIPIHPDNYSFSRTNSDEFSKKLKSIPRSQRIPRIVLTQITINYRLITAKSQGNVKE